MAVLDIAVEETAIAGVLTYRRLAPVDRLHRDGRIDWRAWQAAHRLLDDYEIGHGGRDGDNGGNPPGIRGAGWVGGHTVRQLDAMTAYRQAVRVLGLLASEVVLLVVLEEWTVTKLAARRIGRMDRRVDAVLTDLCSGLGRLADHYGY